MMMMMWPLSFSCTLRMLQHGQLMMCRRCCCCCCCCCEPEEHSDSVDTWMDEAGKALAMRQQLQGDGVSGAACQDVTTDVRLRHIIESRAGRKTAGSTTSSIWPSSSYCPTRSLSTIQDHPPPLIYYQLHYLFMSSSLTCARLWRSGALWRVCS